MGGVATSIDWETKLQDMITISESSCSQKQLSIGGPYTRG
jgi:hypothetical protein